MKKILTLILLYFTVAISHAEPISTGKYATDKLYRDLIKSVELADFDLMASTYHPDAVLVSPKKTSAIATALKRWRKDGVKLKIEGGRATLAFKFKKRIINDETAFETGIYRYSTIDNLGNEKVYFAHFEDLNIKKNNQWFTLMENQTAKATKEEWENLTSLQ